MSQTSSNYRQSLQQSGNILEPYFNLHAEAKRNVIEGLLEMAKVAYSAHRPQKLVYVLDDFSQRMIDLDQDLLDNSTSFPQKTGQPNQCKSGVRR